MPTEFFNFSSNKKFVATVSPFGVLSVMYMKLFALVVELFK